MEAKYKQLDEVKVINKIDEVQAVDRGYNVDIAKAICKAYKEGNLFWERE